MSKEALGTPAVVENLARAAEASLMNVKIGAKEKYTTPHSVVPVDITKENARLMAAERMGEHTFLLFHGSEYVIVLGPDGATVPLKDQTLSVNGSFTKLKQSGWFKKANGFNKLMHKNKSRLASGVSSLWWNDTDYKLVNELLTTYIELCDAPLAESFFKASSFARIYNKWCEGAQKYKEVLALAKAEGKPLSKDKLMLFLVTVEAFYMAWSEGDLAELQAIGLCFKRVSGGLDIQTPNNAAEAIVEIRFEQTGATAQKPIIINKNKFGSWANCGSFIRGNETTLYNGFKVTLKSDVLTVVDPATSKVLVTKQLPKGADMHLTSDGNLVTLLPSGQVRCIELDYAGLVRPAPQPAPKPVSVPSAPAQVQALTGTKAQAAAATPMAEQAISAQEPAATPASTKSPREMGREAFNETAKVSLDLLRRMLPTIVNPNDLVRIIELTDKTPVNFRTHHPDLTDADFADFLTEAHALIEDRLEQILADIFMAEQVKLISGYLAGIKNESSIRDIRATAIANIKNYLAQRPKCKKDSMQFLLGQLSDLFAARSAELNAPVSAPAPVVASPASPDPAPSPAVAEAVAEPAVIPEATASQPVAEPAVEIPAPHPISQVSNAPTVSAVTVEPAQVVDAAPTAPTESAAEAVTKAVDVAPAAPRTMDTILVESFISGALKNLEVSAVRTTPNCNQVSWWKRRVNYHIVEFLRKNPTVTRDVFAPFEAAFLLATDERIAQLKANPNVTEPDRSDEEIINEISETLLGEARRRVSAATSKEDLTLVGNYVNTEVSRTISSLSNLEAYDFWPLNDAVKSLIAARQADLAAASPSDTDTEN